VIIDNNRTRRSFSQGGGSLRVDEKNLRLTFSSNSEGGWNINGAGQNQFGAFTVLGTLSKACELRVYREYDHQRAARIKEQKRNRKGGGQRHGGKAQASYIHGLKINGSSSNEDAQHRDHRRRVSKTPSYLREDEQEPVRLTDALRRCLTLLKQISAVKGKASWFNQPVDYEGLRLVDYPKIIKKPMDLGTVRSRLECGEYDNPDMFAQDVRLVFSNALTYNTDANSAVRTAAVDLSAMFEQRWAALQPLLYSADRSASPAVKRRKGAGGGAGRGASSGKVGAGGRGGGGGAVLKRQKSGSKGMKSPVGPRSRNTSFFESDLSSSAVPSTSQLAEMQMRMAEMQATIQALQRQHSQQSVGGLKSSEPAIATGLPDVLTPLTYEEKRDLSARINKLGPDKLSGVVTIIQERMPLGSSHEGEEVEIDIDSMDTGTLRELQVYVENCLPRRKGVGEGRDDDDRSDSDSEGEWGD
jgi:hypothetical protein